LRLAAKPKVETCCDLFPHDVNNDWLDCLTRLISDMQIGIPRIREDHNSLICATWTHVAEHNLRSRHEDHGGHGK
jgi:hypothetical protein